MDVWSLTLYKKKGGHCSFCLQTSEKSRFIRKFIIKKTGGFDTTFFDKEVQKWICEYIHDNGVLKQEQIVALKARLEQGPINQSQMIMILNENLKGRLPSVKVNLTERKLRKYFPASYTSEDMESVIIALLEEWKRSQGGE